MPIVGYVVKVDEIDVAQCSTGNTSKEFYVLAMAYLDIVATEANTHVRVEQLNIRGGVVWTVERTMTSVGERWRYDAADLQFHRVTSNKPIAVFSSSIEPEHQSDDDFYSLAGTDLWLWIDSGVWGNGAVFITAYHDGTHVTITDYGNGNDSQSFTLNRGEFWEGADAVEPPGEIWRVQASRPVAVMAGYPENDEYEEVRSPDGMEYWFPLIGDDPYIYVVAQADGTYVSIDNLDGTNGDWSGILNRGQAYSAHIPYTRSVGFVEWVRVYVSADKPVRVVNRDPWAIGNPSEPAFDMSVHSGVGSNFFVCTGNGRYLAIIALAPSDVRVTGGHS